MIFDKDYFARRSLTSWKVLRFYFTRLTKEMDFRDIRNKKLLDIGCGLGYFSKIACGFGFEVYGIDISRYAIKQAKKIVDADFFCVDVQNSLPFKDAFFDVVTMFDVIEHLEKPYNALREIHRLLKTNGIFVVTTPNVDSLSRRIKKEKWIGFSDKTHFTLYTVHSLKSVLNKSGFHVLKAETLFTPLPQAISKLLQPFNLGGKIWITSMKRLPNITHIPTLDQTIA